MWIPFRNSIVYILSKPPSGKRLYSCPYCGKLANKTHLKEHVNTVHLKLRPFTCQHCGKTFGKKYNMLCHVRKYHKDIAWRGSREVRCPGHVVSFAMVIDHVVFIVMVGGHLVCECNVHVLNFLQQLSICIYIVF